MVAAAAFALGVFDRLDAYNLDLHFRHCNRIEADPRIVLIDIDDTTLRVMPDWPWPRRTFAELFGTLHDLGASSIISDIVFAEPTRPRPEHAAVHRHYDIDRTAEHGDRAFDETIYDDDELREAIYESGKVVLAMFAALAPPGSLSNGLGDDTDSSEEAKARRDAADFLHASPKGTWREFFRTVRPRTPIDAQSPERETLLLAYRHALALRGMSERLPRTPAELRGRIPKAFDLVLPLDKLTTASQGVGLVSFRRDPQGGVVRSLPLVVDADGLLVPQLGTFAAMRALAIPTAEITLKESRLVFGNGERRRTAPLDSNGTSLVNWHRPADGGGWLSSFRHLPAARLLEITENAAAVADNAKRLAMARAELVQVRHADTPAAYDEYVKLVNRRTPNAPAVEEIERESKEWLHRAWGLWKDENPRTDEEAAERDRLQRLHDRFGGGQYESSLAQADANIRARNAELRSELRREIDGKICLVGYTASALADMIPTPVDPAMPGVMVHAHVLNMFLRNRFAAATPPALGAVLVLVVGLLTAVVSGRCHWRFAVLGSLLLAAVTVAAGAVIFRAASYHVPSFGIIAAIALVWACVAVFRQATEERTRRHLQRALAQYTSPAVAAQVVETARVEGLAPRAAVVSCFFSDLAGFTALSERLGPEKTRALLNPYLREVSAVLLDHRAMVNKFLGDGIFAFFNTPLLPCPDHASAACAAALDAVQAISRLNAEPAVPDLHSSLSVRIGLSTGEAFVGDYGSDVKLDYTCIGDTVNLASRLEGANKFFGTTILTDEATRTAAAGRFVFRPLGLVEVRGKERPVAVHELVDRAECVAAEQLRLIALFEDALRDYQHCRWDQCLTTLAQCRRESPADLAVERYEAEVRRLRTSPPAKDWTTAIRAHEF